MVILMEYRLGNSLRIKERGETLETICPNCKKVVKFGMFSNLERRLVPNIKLVNCSTIFFLVCPECAGIFTVDEQKGDDFKKGNKFAITDTDLMPLKPFRSEDINE